MPYIKYDRRAALVPVAYNRPNDSGELNYQLTCVIQNYLAAKQITYADINNVVGALECCKLEFIRRVVNPYEDKKIEENGDVY